MPKPGAVAAAAPQSDSGGLPAHAAAEGFLLAASTRETTTTGPRCAAGAPVRRYNLVAINVDITVNRFGDHDPRGRMYVLEGDLGRVRAEEAQNARARAGQGDYAVTTGLQGDAIQPLTLRVRPGECLRVGLRNDLNDGKPVTFHLHGSSLSVAGKGPAIATNPAAIARPGRTVEYEWMVGTKEPEATHEFHSHGDSRDQTDHGLFGALVVEPAGSDWIDPLTGRASDTGWAAMVRPTDGPAFREFVLDYHELGDESYQLVDRNNQFVPLVDPITHAYRPDGRDINYRSEPFMDRLMLQQNRFGAYDESLEYSSYGFGDPATPIMRSYLGDPVKQRVIHGGGEVFHVHHTHGGGIRWRRQPDVEPQTFASGLDKHPQLTPAVSERTDAQTIGPSESFDIVDECGSGGCQQSAGDFMFHCHVTEHYFAGMWGVWRVYNTRQDGVASTDTLPPLEQLPDRGGKVQAAVESPSLIGHNVGAYGATNSITTPDDLHRWVEAQLPPPGVPKGYDASVFDWQREGDRYLGEAETTDAWPNYTPRAPGTRRPILFDPVTGKPAYPMLQPHLAKRPPFAPNHGPAPFLDPFHSGADPPAPGENGPASTCPAGTHLKQFNINVINVPVPLSTKDDIVDPNGELYVLRQDVDAVRADPAKRVPLALRANAGEDCIDGLLRSELSDDAENPLSKVSLHVHFMQFDVQGSDGVDTGFNYEQTVRPFRLA
ncbi:MAG: multicopper oxidase domain-containing protein, partial [Actinomycetota bacterium]|nr:multicopper oxidase domain-containing protein [Actinomycetota bacterium]